MTRGRGEGEGRGVVRAARTVADTFVALLRTAWMPVGYAVNSYQLPVASYLLRYLGYRVGGAVGYS